MSDYLIQLHGPYLSKGAKQLWWPERTDSDTSLASTLDQIEEYEREGQTLAMVVKTEDGYASVVTDEIQMMLAEREQGRARERYANPTWGDRADFARALQKAE